MNELEEQTYPEILRCNLSNTVLELLKLGVKVSSLPLHLHFIKRLTGSGEVRLRRCTSTRNHDEGSGITTYLAALDDEGNLTSLGGIMAEFPLDPQLAKMLIISPEFKCSNEIVTITSKLSGSSLCYHSAEDS